MKVFKFGGASVKNAAALKNVASIIKSYSGQLVVVVSAMDKTTNFLEEVWTHFIQRDKEKLKISTKKVIDFHIQVMDDLTFDPEDEIRKIINKSFKRFQQSIDKEPSDNPAYEYDQIVSYGEIWSTLIVSGYLNLIGIKNKWIDARKTIRTTNHYQEARVVWEKAQELIKEKTNQVFQNETGAQIIFTQGFIGHTDTGMTTTLGREGSDFSASILAWCLDAQEVLIWKDVAGVLNADPKEFKETIKLDKISYKEAIELSYFGASVIHPKTLKPLQNKKIPLKIKSFIDPKAEGTIIQQDENEDGKHPSYIYNPDQLLLSISPKDFSFIMEDHISEIFKLFSLHGLKVHLMQNSALNFSVCAKIKPLMQEKLITDLSEKFNVRYNNNVDLLTIRHYKEHVFPEKLKQKQVLIKQRSRSTLRYVLA